MIICTSETIICELKMIAGVASIIVCGWEMVLCSMTMIADATRIIVPEAEKTKSLTELIAEEMEILVSPSSTIADDMEMIVKKTELIGTTAAGDQRSVGIVEVGFSGRKLTAHPHDACLRRDVTGHGGFVILHAQVDRRYRSDESCCNCVICSDVDDGG